MNILDENESLEQLGEFGLIERIKGFFDSNSHPDFEGIGDDCAVIRDDSGQSTLVSTDMLLEGRHFRRVWSSAEDIGYKSLAVNLSDISAMGGNPKYALLGIGLPPDIDPGWLNRFFNESHKLCNANDVKLIGGDTVKSDILIINYMVMGTIGEKNILWRSGAKPGDKIGLFGNVGDSGAGLRLLEESRKKSHPMHRHLIKAHNRPSLHVDEARFLAKTGYAHAMIDISDGIQSDAGHIAKQSGVSLNIDINLLPLSDQLIEVCSKYSWPLEEIALTAGEDYSLLFTFDSGRERFLKEQFRESFGYDFSVIGEVEKGKAEVRFIKNREKFELLKHGFDQFKNP